MYTIIEIMDEITMHVPPELAKSKSQREKVLNHVIDVDDKRRENEWTSCCVRMDKRAVRFFTQLCISICIISLYIAQLIRLNDCGSQHAYIGLLTLIIGIWLPSPSMNK